MSGIRHKLHVLLTPCADLPGEWVAHCLELDLATQGTGAFSALEMLAEAIELAAESNERAGLPPLVFSGASLEDWRGYEDGDDVFPPCDGEGGRVAVRLIRLTGAFPDEIALEPLVRRAS